MATVNVTLSPVAVDTARISAEGRLDATSEQSFASFAARFSGAQGAPGAAGPSAISPGTVQAYSGYSEGPGVTTLAIGEEDGGAYQPSPSSTYQTPSAGDGEYQVTTLAIGEEDGGYVPSSSMQIMDGMAPISGGDYGTMAPIYSPGDPTQGGGYVQEAQTIWSGGDGFALRGEYGTMQPIYSPGEPEYDAFAKASAGPDVLNFTYIERVQVQASPVQITAQAPVTISAPALDANYVSVGSYDSFINGGEAPTLMSESYVIQPSEMQAVQIESIQTPMAAPLDEASYVSIGSLDDVLSQSTEVMAAPAEPAIYQEVAPTAAPEYNDSWVDLNQPLAPAEPSYIAMPEIQTSAPAVVDMGGSYQIIDTLPEGPSGLSAVDPATMDAPVNFEPIDEASQPADYAPPAEGFDGASLENAPAMYEYDPVYVDPQAAESAGAGAGDEDLRITTLAIGEEDGGS